MEEDDDNKTTARKSVAMNSRSRKAGGSDAKLYSQEYDDEENAADIEDADKVDDEDEHSGSQVRKPRINKKGLYKEDIANGSSTVMSNGLGARALNGSDLKKKFHF
jgi:hypothetical protein